MRNPPFSLLYLALACVATSAVAQQPPDAGRVQRENSQPPSLEPRPGLPLKLEQPLAGAVEPGGAVVSINRVEFMGHTLVDDATLEKLVSDLVGRQHDLAGLRAIAERVTQYYRSLGYPFARAYLMPQSVQEGVLHVGILEGRYGQVRAQGEEAFISGAAKFLAPLKPGDPIQVELLERTLLVLGDLPGVKVTPVISPGQGTGTGDLTVSVSRAATQRYEVGYDNHGNRYTGEHRVKVNAQFLSPLMMGDQIIVRGAYSNGDLWLGGLDYSLPIGAAGLTATAGYSRTAYQLGADFSSLDASGTAGVTNLGLSYPLVRTTARNLSVSVSLQRKELRDIQRAVQSDEKKSSQLLPVVLQFDQRDSVWGGGLIYGALTFTAGHLKLGDTARQVDVISGRNSEGSFHKVNVDAVRLQTLGDTGVTLFARVAVQRASKNLDSSEKMSLGGPNGVRAYPSGEGTGDQGHLAQIELRTSFGRWSPFAFYDFGRTEVNARPGDLVAPPAQSARSVAGAGVGVRYSEGPWNIDLAAATRTQGGMSMSEPSARSSRAWVSLAYKF